MISQKKESHCQARRRGTMVGKTKPIMGMTRFKIEGQNE
jgi:hypothetical protein